MSAFLGHAASHAAQRAGPTIRLCVVTGLSLTKTKFSVLRTFEEAYWRSLESKDIFLDRDLENARTDLANWIHSTARRASINPTGPITLNVLPYAEAAYFYIFCAILKIGYGVTLVLEPLDYSKVLSSIESGHLNMAVHNPTIFAQESSNAAQRSLVASRALINFRRYDVLASRSFLRRVVLGDSCSPEARALAVDLLDGRTLADPEPGEDRSALTELAREGGIAALRTTDTEKAALQFFGSEAADDIRNYDPDEGLERLLNEEGSVGFYVGGALQSHYAKTICQTRVAVAGVIEMHTNVHFYAPASTYKEHRRTYDDLIVIWSVVPSLLDLLKHPDRAPSAIEPLIVELRQHITIQINKNRAVRNGFASSFDELSALLDRHDTLENANIGTPLFKVIRKQDSKSKKTVAKYRPQLTLVSKN